MSHLFLFGALCAFAPWLLSRLHPLLGSLTLPLVYVLVAIQLLVVPVLVALDPDISFGSDSYSLGAGVAIALIGGAWMIFAAGSGLGLLLATMHIRRREHAQAAAQYATTLAELQAGAPPVE